MIFETRKKKFSVHKENVRTPDSTEDEFWKQVNESLILAAVSNEEEVSKDLMDVMENLVTDS